MTSTNTSPELPPVIPPSAGGMGAFRTMAIPDEEKTAPVFGEMELPARVLREQNWNNYRVYKNKDEFVLVEGVAAYDAIARSGVVRPVKVVRAMKELGDVLTNQHLMERTEETHKDESEKIPKNGIIDPPAPGSTETSSAPVQAAEPPAPDVAAEPVEPVPAEATAPEPTLEAEASIPEPEPVAEPLAPSQAAEPEPEPQVAEPPVEDVAPEPPAAEAPAEPAVPSERIAPTSETNTRSRESIT